MAQSPLQRIVAALKKRYGKPTPPPAGRDPLALMFYEMVAYLTDDDTRASAFATLKQQVGLAPSAVRGTRLVVLTAICREGGPVQPEHRARRMAEVAAIVQDEFDGNLAQVLTWDYPKAVRALRRFPSVAEPGADRILMLCGSHAVLGMESNALRVLCRLGYAEETKNYTQMYRDARDAAMAELPKRASVMAEVSLLREHKQYKAAYQLLGQAVAKEPKDPDLLYDQAMMAEREKMMADMKAADQRLDDLVAKMNTAAGMDKTAATAAVVTEMVAQHRTMQQGMMKRQQGMMEHMMEHMQAGKDSMAMCPMMKPMGDMKH